MHPFGGTPICPRCSKAVYAAEQAMGPGRRLYHKPCLACTICNKRLDSLTLLEHDQQPYCKSCHVKNFGTRDLRQANLPHREGSVPSPLPASPIRQNTFNTPPRTTTSHSPTRQGRVSSSPPVRPRSADPNTPTPVSPVSLPNRMLSPASISSYLRGRPLVESDEEDTELELSESMDQVITQPTLSPRSLSPSYALGAFTDTGRGLGLVSLQGETAKVNERPSHRPSHSLNMTPVKFSAVTLGRSNSSAATSVSHSPLAPTATGTRYGMAFNVTGTSVGGSPTRSWGGGTPICPKCRKSVFFAEQVKAAGQTWHKGCLRCTECGTSLDSTRLTENEGQPLCRRCYSKLHGPQGSGYALLGKAGG